MTDHPNVVTLGGWLMGKLPVIVDPPPDEIHLKALAYEILESSGLLDAPIIPAADGKTRIVWPEAWEAFRAALKAATSAVYDPPMDGFTRDELDKFAPSIASALLGGPVEVAEEVREAIDTTGIQCFDEKQGIVECEILPGDRFAILAEKETNNVQDDG